jgi:hypothetical protein
VKPGEDLGHWGGAKRRNYPCDSAHFEQLKKKGVLHQCGPKKTFMTKTRVHARRRLAKLSELTGRSAKRGLRYAGLYGGRGNVQPGGGLQSLGSERPEDNRAAHPADALGGGS